MNEAAKFEKGNKLTNYLLFIAAENRDMNKEEKTKCCYRNNLMITEGQKCVWFRPGMPNLLLQWAALPFEIIEWTTGHIRFKGKWKHRETIKGC